MLNRLNAGSQNASYGGVITKTPYTLSFASFFDPNTNQRTYTLCDSHGMYGEKYATQHTFHSAEDLANIIQRDFVHVEGEEVRDDINSYQIMAYTA